MDSRIVDTTELFEPSPEHFPGLSVGVQSYDVAAVRHRNPLAVIGRALGGCMICGAINPGWQGWMCIGNPPKTGHIVNLTTCGNPAVCMPCFDKYIA